jgi:hypothetical protein
MIRTKAVPEIPLRFCSFPLRLGSRNHHDTSRSVAGDAQGDGEGGVAPGDGGESILRVHWVAVPEAVRARRVNRLAGARDRLLQGARMIIGSPCALLASHGASLTSRFDSQMAKLRHKFTRNWFALWHDPAAPADDLMLLVYEIWVFHDRNGRDG